MFRHLFILVLVTMTNCQNDTEEEVDAELPVLPTPRLTTITILDPPGFTVEWAPVESDEKNPVAGFKATVWESEKDTFFSPIDLEGIGRVYEKSFRLTDKSIDEIPVTDPIVQNIEANVTMARFENLKTQENYQVRVQAVNDLGDDGPYSNVLVIRIGEDTK